MDRGLDTHNSVVMLAAGNEVKCNISSPEQVKLLELTERVELHNY